MELQLSQSHSQVLKITHFRSSADVLCFLRLPPNLLSKQYCDNTDTTSLPDISVATGNCSRVYLGEEMLNGRGYDALCLQIYVM